MHVSTRQQASPLTIQTQPTTCIASIHNTTFHIHKPPSLLILKTFCKAQILCWLFSSRKYLQITFLNYLAKEISIKPLLCSAPNTTSSLNFLGHKISSYANKMSRILQFLRIPYLETLEFMSKRNNIEAHGNDLFTMGIKLL
jgi:hypothetical protein